VKQTRRPNKTCAIPLGPSILADENRDGGRCRLHGADRAVRVERVADRAVEAVGLGPIDGRRRLLGTFLSGARGLSLPSHHLTCLYQAFLGLFFSDNVTHAVQYTTSGNRLSPGNSLQVRSAESRAPRLKVSRPTKGLAAGLDEGQSS
jgi:hypothetical protein